MSVEQAQKSAAVSCIWEMKPLSISRSSIIKILSLLLQRVIVENVKRGSGDMVANGPRLLPFAFGTRETPVHVKTYFLWTVLSG